jgi:hypothetical protein
LADRAEDVNLIECSPPRIHAETCSLPNSIAWPVDLLPIGSPPGDRQNGTEFGVVVYVDLGVGGRCGMSTLPRNPGLFVRPKTELGGLDLILAARRLSRVAPVSPRCCRSLPSRSVVVHQSFDDVGQSGEKVRTTPGQEGVNPVSCPIMLLQPGRSLPTRAFLAVTLETPPAGATPGTRASAATAAGRGTAIFEPSSP